MYSLLLVKFEAGRDGEPVGKYPEDNSYWVVPDYREIDNHGIDLKTMRLPGLYLVGITRASFAGNARLCRILCGPIEMTAAEALENKMRFVDEYFLDPLKVGLTQMLQFEGVEAFETEVEFGGFKVSIKARRRAHKDRICGIRRCTGKVDVTIVGMPWPLTQKLSFVVDEVSYHGDMINDVMPANALAS